MERRYYAAGWVNETVFPVSKGKCWSLRGCTTEKSCWDAAIAGNLSHFSCKLELCVCFRKLPVERISNLLQW